MLGTALLVYVVADACWNSLFRGAIPNASKERGATEAGAAHYPFMVALHVSWLAGYRHLGDINVAPVNAVSCRCLLSLQVSTYAVRRAW